MSANTCGGCQDITMNLSDIAICGISKSEVINLMQNINLTRKSGIINMCEKVLTFGDIDIEKINFINIKFPFCLEDVDIEKKLVSNKISSLEKTVNTLLITCIMILI